MDNLDEPVKMVEHPTLRNVWIEPENELTPAQQDEFDRLARNGNECRVSIWHGPGHQSRTECRMIGDHTMHEAIYGEFNQFASWRGNRDITSGYLDDFNEEEDISYVRDDWTLRHRRRITRLERV